MVLVWLLRCAFGLMNAPTTWFQVSDLFRICYSAWLGWQWPNLIFFFWVCTTIYLCIYNQNTALTCFLAFTTRNNRDLTNCCYCVIKLRHSYTDFRNARPMSLYFLPLLPRTKPLWIVMRLYDSMYIAPSSHLSMFCVHMAVFMKTLGSLCPSDPHEDCCKIERSPINEVIANL